MVRTVFFSFHFKRDAWRAGQVRNSWLTQPDRKSAGFIEGSDWEEIERQGDAAIRRWIDNQLKGTSVTAVLIGKETSERRWVNYEIVESVKKGNGIVGIYIDNIKGKNGLRDTRGINPLTQHQFSDTGRRYSDAYYTYDWVLDRGYDNFGDWVEEAANIAGR
jgi:hypothetical protein